MSFFSTAGLTREGIAQLTATVSGLLSATAQSVARYVRSGPRHAAWDFRTHVVRDVLFYLLVHQADSGVQMLYRLTNAPASWPALSGGLQRVSHGAYASRVDIPTYPLGDVAGGAWLEGLRSVEQASAGRIMAGECIVAETADRAAQGRRRGGPRAVLHFHGGAYVSGTLEQYRSAHLALSQAVGLPVYGFAYRLAPGSQYPTQLYDAFCAYSHVRSLGYAEREIVFSGDSAGGNLALALWQLVKPDLHSLVLVSPRVDVASTRGSWVRNAGADILPPYNVHDPRNSLHKLLVSPGQPVSQDVLDMLADPFISPIHADLAGLPPALIQAATAEVMYDDIAEFARRAQAASSRSNDTAVTFQTFAGGFHDFQLAPILVQNAIEARQAIGAFIWSLATASS
ncbi:hypothetical protein GGI04_002511 [Coemansia thaxteri]|nr:hypothetical protein GGI04_002511 [Coemansia thaxteri]